MLSSLSEHVRREPSRIGRRAWVSLVAALVVWVVVLGPVITLLVHLQYGKLLSEITAPGALDPALVSLASAGIAIVAIALLGTYLGAVIARGKGWVARILEGGVVVMLLMPPLVIGLLLVFFVGPLTPLGEALAKIHLSATNTFFALIVASGYEAMPYYILGVVGALRGVDPRLEEQAALLGDRPRRVFWRVSAPMAAPQMAVSLAIAWARAIGAFGAVIIIAYHPYGIPMQIWTTLDQVGLAAALPFALLLLVVALPFPLAALLYARHARG